MTSLAFRCKRCKKEFPLEEHPSPAYKKYLKESDNDDNEDGSIYDQFHTKLKKVTESIHCPACQSGVYLTGIGGIITGEFDLTSEPIVQSIHSAVNNLSKGDYVEYKERVEEIITMLLDNPGKLIYIEDPELKKEALKEVKIIWANTEWDNLFDRMVEEGTMVAIIGEYVDRAKRLYPTFIDQKIDNRTSVYFQNAIESWLFGLNDAAVILCWSVIEFILKENYPLHRNQTKDMKEFIDAVTNDGHIDNNLAEKMHRIRKSRNFIVHHRNRRTVSSDDVFSMIRDTKEIIESIL